MKRTILRLIQGGILSFSYLAMGDDGWIRYVDISHGVVYAEHPHPQIQLQNEILLLTSGDSPYDEFMGGAHFTAIMDFNNTSDKSVKVSSGFPINISFSKDSPDGVTLLKTFGVVKAADCDKDSCGAIQFAEDLNKKVKQIFSIQEYEKIVKGSSLNTLTPPVLELDGLPISHKSVFFSFDQEKSNAQIDFLHEQNFSAKKKNQLKIRYEADFQRQIMGGMSCSYDTKYVLRTAATWKGPFENLYFLYPPELTLNEENNFEDVGMFAGLRILRKKNLLAHDLKDLDLSHNDGCYSRENIRRLIKEYEIEQPKDVLLQKAKLGKIIYRNPLVEITGDSAHIGDINKIIRYDTASRYLDPGKPEDSFIRFDAPFSAISLVDHFPETAWCYNSKKKAEASFYVKMKKNVSAIGFLNGYQKPQFPLEPDPEGKELFFANGRIKKIRIVNKAKALIKEIELKDTKLFQIFEVSLPAGDYEFLVTDTEQGKKSADVCLSEVDFLPEAPQLSYLVKSAEDSISRAAFQSR